VPTMNPRWDLYTIFTSGGTVFNALKRSPHEDGVTCSLIVVLRRWPPFAALSESVIRPAHRRPPGWTHDAYVKYRSRSMP
jgi:hypothetical protein